jgi:hypothetical protein
MPRRARYFRSGNLQAQAEALGLVPPGAARSTLGDSGGQWYSWRGSWRAEQRRAHSFPVPRVWGACGFPLHPGLRYIHTSHHIRISQSLRCYALTLQTVQTLSTARRDAVDLRPNHPSPVRGSGPPLAEHPPKLPSGPQLHTVEGSMGSRLP